MQVAAGVSTGLGVLPQAPDTQITSIYLLSSRVPPALLADEWTSYSVGFQADSKKCAERRSEREQGLGGDALIPPRPPRA